MARAKDKWDDIPAISGLEVDWDYEPENPLGKREQVRIGNTDLRALLGVRGVPIKVAAKNFEGKGYIVDIASGGLGVLLGSRLEDKQPVMVGFFLGKQKVISRAIVRNIRKSGEKYRIGMEFVDLPHECGNFINGLVSSKNYMG